MPPWCTCLVCKGWVGNVQIFTTRAVPSYDSLNSLFCEVCAVVLVCIQLFRERLSYKRREPYATMSKVIMGNGGFYRCLSEPQGFFSVMEGSSTNTYSFFSFLVAESPWTSIKQSQTLTTHNSNRDCRVRFYTCGTTFVETAVRSLLLWSMRSHGVDLSVSVCFYIGDLNLEVIEKFQTNKTVPFFVFHT